MGATTAFKTACLQHYFNNSAHANIGDASGLQPAGTVGVVYLSLHTSDPGAGGNQATNETSYGSYARISLNRDGTDLVVSGANLSNGVVATFPSCSSGTATITHVGLGTAASGAGNLIASGALVAPLAVSAGVAPKFQIGQLDLNFN